MDVLIISDENESKSFEQIIILKNEIQELIKKQVDLLSFSNDQISLNGKIFSDRNTKISTDLKRLLYSKTYSLIIITLTKKNLSKLISVDDDVLNLIDSPRTKTYIFGALSSLKELQKKGIKNSLLFRRRGVSKLTKEFKSDIIEFLKLFSKNNPL